MGSGATAIFGNQSQWRSRNRLGVPKGRGYHSFIIANADTVMARPNAELLAEVYPGVPLKKEVGPNETLQSIDKARRVLGYDPQYSWRTGASTQIRPSE